MQTRMCPNQLSIQTRHVLIFLDKTRLTQQAKQSQQDMYFKQTRLNLAKTKQPQQETYRNKTRLNLIKLKQSQQDTY